MIRELPSAAGIRTERGHRRYAIHGVRVDLDSDVQIAIDAVDASYSAFAASSQPGPAVRRSISLRRDGSAYRSIDHDGQGMVVLGEQRAVVGLFDLVIRAVLDGLAEVGIIAFHAGAVELGGRALILAGASGRGKSTLTLGLLRAGGNLLTDEMALVGPDDRTVLPYPRSAHVRQDTLAMLPELGFISRRPRYDLGGGSEWSVDAHDLAAAFGARVAGPTRLGGIVILDGSPDGGRVPTLELISPAVATMELLRGTPAATIDFAGTVQRVSGIASQVRCARLRSGRLDRTTAMIGDWLEQSG